MKNQVKFLPVLAAFIGFGTSLTSCDNIVLAGHKKADLAKTDSITNATAEDFSVVAAQMDSIKATMAGDTSKSVEQKNAVGKQFFVQVAQAFTKKHPTVSLLRKDIYATSLDGSKELLEGGEIDAHTAVNTATKYLHYKKY